ncbi:MAG: peroxide stress protein YaaA [Bacteroidetes bacterium]|nr:peroxide stress protein YaaA [Bacteroidota bacterium]MDA0937291.1 peroxide stress protein YaaA [Bacteroidota bacterium]MDA1345428.1 peroxide stress protein YaaA [Bacteroidota bacterium]
MKIVISPAKSLQLDGVLPAVEFTQPVFLNEAAQVNTVLRKKSVKALGALMGISENLSNLNWQRNQEFQLPFRPTNARPAVYTFSGDVYQGLDVGTLQAAKIPVMQERLRILSGLYGWLRPLDLIQAYRLEMGTTLKIGSNKDLYAFWKTKITAAINEEMAQDDLLVNLASNEYFKAIDAKKIDATIVSPQFKDYKNGQLKIISFFAKKARGVMARYLLETNAKNIEDVLAFAEDGYRYSEADTKDALQPVFVR